MNYEGKKVIVRSDRAGVFYGEIAEKDGQNVVMTNVRRLWWWEGANSISDLAKHGTQSPNECKFTIPVDSIEFFDVIEIILCTKEAEESIDEVSVWTKRK